MSCCNCNHCMICGVGCAHFGFDCDNFVFLCVEESECLCVRRSVCCAPGVPNKGCGCVTEDDECCKIGCFCCNYGCLVPQSLCKGAQQCCCLYQVVSFPCHEDYVKSCVCAVYGLQCAPNCGCCADYGETPKGLDKLVNQEMQR